MNVIQVEGLMKKYNNFQLGPVSFSVPEGSIVGFIGENGAGKTTTIKAIMGMLKPDEGRMIIIGIYVGVFALGYLLVKVLVENDISEEILIAGRGPFIIAGIFAVVVLIILGSYFASKKIFLKKDF